MIDEFKRKVLYAGCKLLCLNHVSHFSYYPPNPKDYSSKEEFDEEIFIYFSVQIRNYWTAIVPPLLHLNRSHYWSEYIQYNWLKRVGISVKYLFNKNYQRKGGILDCFNFSEEDFSKIDSFLSNITDNISSKIDQEDFVIDGSRWRILFTINKYSHSEPYEFGWEIQFKPRGFFGRLKWAYNYLFGNVSREEFCEIEPDEAALLRGMIKWTQEQNKKGASNG